MGDRGRRLSADFRPAVGGLTREGTWFDAARRNLDLIDLARAIESDGRAATPDEQALLSKYVGFGAGEIRNNLFPVAQAWQKTSAPRGALVFPEAVREARWKPLAERAAALPIEWQRTILQSTQYAHYTSEGIVRSMWSAVQRLGFTGGKIFEPGNGIGTFPMLMPDSVRATSKFTGIEFDAPTALIARLLSPDQQMLHDDFTKRKLPDDYFDVVVGNPPFSATQVLADPRYEKHGFMLHDYFFAKSMDKLRPGGVLAFVTSKGTMDKQTDKARRYLSARADFLGAVRLPSTAFEANAGTSVVTDVIFLRKRLPGEAPGGLAWNKLKTVETKDGPTPINEYFADHPEMVLGQHRISGNTDDEGRRINSNGMGGEKYTVVSYDKTPAELDAKFAAAIERLPANVYSVMNQAPAAIKAEVAKIDFNPTIKREGVVYVKDGALMRVFNGVGKDLTENVKLSAKDQAWMGDYVGLRDLVQQARHQQVTDGDWQGAMRKLNRAYEKFVKANGPINAFSIQMRKSTDEDGNEIEVPTRVFLNKRLFREDYDAAIVTQLETIDDEGNITKGAFLRGRTIGKPEPATEPDAATPAQGDDAGNVALFSQNAAPDKPSTVATATAEIASLFGKSADSVVTVVANVDALPPSIAKLMREADASAVTIDKRHVYIVADRVAPGAVRGLVLHELGVHYGMGASQVAELTAQVKRWAAGNSPLAEKARQALKAAAASSSTHTDEEAVAYMVQALVDAGIDPSKGSPSLRRFFAMLAKAFKDAARALGLTLDMTPQDMVDYAYGAAKMALQRQAPSAESQFADASQFSQRSILGAVDAVASLIAPHSPIVGNTGRQYNAAQQAAMRNVGFNTDETKASDRIKALWQDAGKKLAQGIADQFAPVKEISEKAYMLLRLSKGASGAFEALLHGGKLKLSDGAYDFDEARRGGVIDKLLIPLQGEHHDFLRWVAANRAERLIGEGKENLFTPEDIEAIKSLSTGVTDFDYTVQNGQGAGAVTRDRTLIYADALRTFNGFSKNVLDMAEQSGLIDAESRAVWEHDFYVPFYRVTDEGDYSGAAVKSGVVRQQAFKQLKGGKDKLNTDLLDNTLLNWAHLLDAAAKNRAAKAALEAMADMGAAIEAPASVATQIGRAVGAKSGPVWFMDEGVKRFFLVDDPYLMTAISGLQYGGLKGPAMQALGAFKHMLTVGVTASPFFKVRNLIRDSVQVIATSPIGVNPIANVKEGWKNTKKGTDEYFRLLAGGGTIHFGTMLEGSEAKRVQALVESGVDSASILNSREKVKGFYRHYIEPGITAYNELGNRGEAVNRAALYKQLVAQGKSHAEASLMARDLMDFSMQGSFQSIRFLSQVVPFFNARIQGMYKLGRAAKENPRRFAAVLGTTSLVSLALLAAYSDDDDWKKREDWDRNNFWWFKLGGTAFRIPKPFEIGAIATLAERSAEYLMDDEMTGKRFRTQLLTLLGDNLSMNPIPQAFKPMLDVYSNRDSFTDRPIETMGMERLKSEYRMREGSSMVARGASTAANAVTGLIGKEALSPVQIDHLIRGYFGWLGTFVVSASDIVARPAASQPDQAAPDYWKRATGAMVSDLRDAPSRYVSQMYSQAKEIEEAYATWRELVKTGKADDAAEFRADNAEVIGSRHSVERAKRRMAILNSEVKRIGRDEVMDATQKRDALRQIQRQQSVLAQRLTVQ